MRLKYCISRMVIFVLSAALISSGCSSAEQRLDDEKEPAPIPVTALASRPALKEESENYGENRSMRWFHSRGAQNTAAIALVIHGLNLRPEKMESITTRLVDSGIDALNLSLRGHGQNYPHPDHGNSARTRLEAFKSVSYHIWRNETYRAYTLAKKASVKKNVPLVFVGFSLGGLIGADLFASTPDVQFEKMVLFAPAIQMHLRNHFIRILAPFRKMVIPSFALESYQANKGTPIAAYNALFEFYKHFQQHINIKINVPTVIFIDPMDEIVSVDGLTCLMQKERLNEWRLYLIEKEAIGAAGKFHHLIIDEKSTGIDIWKDMMKVMVAHLLFN